MMKSSAFGAQRPSFSLGSVPALPNLGSRGEQLSMRLVANAKTNSSEEGRSSKASNTAKTQSSKTVSSREAKTQSSREAKTLSSKTVSSREAKTLSSREAKTQSSRLANTQSSRTSSREEEEEKLPPKPLIDEQLIADVKAKVEYLRSKPQLLAVSAGAVLGLGLTAVIISAIHDVPLLPKGLELAGLGYSAWFVYKYLLQQAGRQQLSKDIEALKEKVLEA